MDMDGHMDTDMGGDKGGMEHDDNDDNDGGRGCREGERDWDDLDPWWEGLG